MALRFALIRDVPRAFYLRLLLIAGIAWVGIFFSGPFRSIAGTLYRALETRGNSLGTRFAEHAAFRAWVQGLSARPPVQLASLLVAYAGRGGPGQALEFDESVTYLLYPLHAFRFAFDDVAKLKAIAFYGRDAKQLRGIPGCRATSAQSSLCTVKPVRASNAWNFELVYSGRAVNGRITGPSPIRAVMVCRYIDVDNPAAMAYNNTTSRRGLGKGWVKLLHENATASATHRYRLPVAEDPAAYPYMMNRVMVLDGRRNLIVSPPLPIPRARAASDHR